MTTIVLAFLAGLVCGGMLGVTLTALCVAARAGAG